MHPWTVGGSVRTNSTGSTWKLTPRRFEPATVLLAGNIAKPRPASQELLQPLVQVCGRQVGKNPR